MQQLCAPCGCAPSTSCVHYSGLQLEQAVRVHDTKCMTYSFAPHPSGNYVKSMQVMLLCSFDSHHDLCMTYLLYIVSMPQNHIAQNSAFQLVWEANAQQLQHCMFEQAFALFGTKCMTQCSQSTSLPVMQLCQVYMQHVDMQQCMYKSVLCSLSKSLDYITQSFALLGSCLSGSLCTLYC